MILGALVTDSLCINSDLYFFVFDRGAAQHSNTSQFTQQMLYIIIAHVQRMNPTAGLMYNSID